MGQRLEDGEGFIAGGGLAALRDLPGDDRWTQRSLSGIVGRLDGRITQEAQQVTVLVMLSQALLEPEIFFKTTRLLETLLDLSSDCLSLALVLRQRAVPLMEALMQLKRCVEIHQQLLRVCPSPSGLLKLHVQGLLARPDDVMQAFLLLDVRQARVVVRAELITAQGESKSVLRTWS